MLPWPPLPAVMAAPVRQRQRAHPDGPLSRGGAASKGGVGGFPVRWCMVGNAGCGGAGLRTRRGVAGAWWLSLAGDGVGGGAAGHTWLQRESRLGLEMLRVLWPGGSCCVVVPLGSRATPELLLEAPARVWVVVAPSRFDLVGVAGPWPRRACPPGVVGRCRWSVRAARGVLAWPFEDGKICWSCLFLALAGGGVKRVSSAVPGFGAPRRFGYDCKVLLQRRGDPSSLLLGKSLVT